MTNKQLIKKLENAGIVCHDCGKKYGVYSVGCSSTWQAKCPICEEIKGCTQTRDYGYLMTGIRKLLKEDVKEQSKEVAEYMFTQTQESEHDTRLKAAKNLLTKEPLMTDEDLDRVMNPSYMRGDIQCWFTEEEVGFLNECLDVICENHKSLCAGHSNEKPEDVAIFESVEKKVAELYENHCVTYKLSSLKELALEALREAESSGCLYVNGRSDTIRKALEALPND